MSCVAFVTLCGMSLALWQSHGMCDPMRETLYSRGVWVRGVWCEPICPQHMVHMYFSCQEACFTARILPLLKSVCALCIPPPMADCVAVQWPCKQLLQVAHSSLRVSASVQVSNKCT
jgi:hypothetical protein